MRATISFVTSHCHRRHRPAIFLRFRRRLDAAQWHSSACQWRPDLASAKSVRGASTHSQTQVPELVPERERRTQASLATERLPWDGKSLPSENDYIGLGRLFKTLPEITLGQIFGQHGCMKLEVNAASARGGHHVCILHCKIMHTSEIISIHESASNKVRTLMQPENVRRNSVRLTCTSPKLESWL